MGYLKEQSVHSIDSRLELVDIQSRVYKAVKVIGKTSIDSEGAVQIGLDKYSGGTLASKKSASCCELWKRPFAWAIEGKVVGVGEFTDPFTPGTPPLLNIDY